MALKESTLVFRNVDEMEQTHTSPVVIIILKHNEALTDREALRAILTNWKNSGCDQETLNEAINIGDGGFTGLSLTVTNIEDVLRAHLPKGWEIVKFIAIYTDKHNDIFEPI